MISWFRFYETLLAACEARRRQRWLSSLSLGVVARENVFADLRAKYFEIPRPDWFPAPSTADEPWGVIMEIGYPEAVVTTVAFTDGTASVLRSSGGGFFGGGTPETVQPARGTFLSEAAKQSGFLSPATTDFPQPVAGQVAFYVRTDGGVRSALSSEDELSSHAHPLSSLFSAGLRILHEYLELQKASDQRRNT